MSLSNDERLILAVCAHFGLPADDVRITVAGEDLPRDQYESGPVQGGNLIATFNGQFAARVVLTRVKGRYQIKKVNLTYPGSSGNWVTRTWSEKEGPRLEC